MAFIGQPPMADVDADNVQMTKVETRGKVGMFARLSPDTAEWLEKTRVEQRLSSISAAIDLAVRELAKRERDKIERAKKKGAK